MTIKENAAFLKLSYTYSHIEEFLKYASEENMNNKAFLEALLDEEASLRHANGQATRIKRAGFPYMKYLMDFNTAVYSADTAARIERLKGLDFVEAGENVILIGNPGTGKTHLAIALGIEACMKGKKVLYASVPNLVVEMKEEMSNNQLTTYRRKFERYDLVILDELGYISFDREGSEMLFNLLSNRNDCASTVITTNLSFEKWENIFEDPILTSALVDRMAHRAHVLDMSGDSYRIKETKEWME